MISLDTETTGKDFWHGAKPFIVTTCDEAGVNSTWEWPVDPLTRQPTVTYDDLQEIQDAVDAADVIVCQNCKFDLQALQTVFLGRLRWDWAKVRDTLLAGHLLASNEPHDLTSLALTYLRVDVQPYEDRMEAAVKEARRVAKQRYPEWRVAKAGLPEMPSAGEKTWKLDCWLPRAIWDHLWSKEAFEQQDPGKKTWATVTREYADSDSAVTLALWRVQERLLRERGLWAIYLERLKVLPVAYEMEARGVTLNRGRLEELRVEYREESARAGRVCANVAASLGAELTLPKSGNNGSLVEFAFGPLGLEPVARSKKTGKPSLDKATLEHWEATLPERSKQVTFVRALRGKRKRDTALNYMSGYEKFWLPLKEKGEQETRLLQHPGIRGLEADDQAMHRPQLQGLQGLGRAGHKGLQQVDKLVSEVPNRHGTEADTGTSNRADKQRRELQPKQLLLGNSEATMQKHAKKPQPSVQWQNRNSSRVGGDNQDQVPNDSNSTPVRLGSKRHSDPLNRGAVQGSFDSGHSGGSKNKDSSSKNISGSTEAVRTKVAEWYVLHPSLNSTGTDTLRWSSSSPNEQNISKQENFNLRYVFGPASGREWWSFDYENIELRIPGYESNERAMIELFERPDDPPYFGSYHLMNASIVYPDLFWPLAEQKGEFKRRYSSTWYKWIKNFGFAIGYGAIIESGTADRAARKPGAQQLVADRLKEHTKLNQSMIAHAEQYGYVETIPDRSIGSVRGYPLYCSRGNWGKISPTIPLNYHVQGTAMQCTEKAMTRTSDFLRQMNQAQGIVDELTRRVKAGLEDLGFYLVMQVHDELVFDFPAGDNVEVVAEVRRLMEMSGDDIGIPLKVSASLHRETWAEGEDLRDEPKRKPQPSLAGAARS